MKQRQTDMEKVGGRSHHRYMLIGTKPGTMGAKAEGGINGRKREAGNESPP